MSAAVRQEIFDLPRCAGRGIYYLMYRGQCVYVGQSKCNLFSRLGQHVRDKHFDAVKWGPVADDLDIDAIERELIRHLQPVYNSAHK